MCASLCTYANLTSLMPQNMHWPEGTVYGTDLVTAIRSLGFNGLIVMRTANDAEGSEAGYLRLGVDAVLSKGMSVKALTPTLLQLQEYVVQHPDRHKKLIDELIRANLQHLAEDGATAQEPGN